MKIKTTLLLLLLLGALAACGRAEKAQPNQVRTETIAPAVAQTAPNDSDAMTQTVEVEDSRSVDDGGTLTTQTSTGGTKTATAASQKPAAKPAKKKS